MKEMGHNCYFASRGAPVWTGWGERTTLQDWQKEGLEVGSIVADPQFMDPANGDYRVAPGSPALKLGFKNFPMDRFGVTSPALKKRVPERIFPDCKGVAGETTGTTRRSNARASFLGGAIKNMVDDAEKSAVGIGEITGVLVMHAPEGSALAGAALKEGDLIVACNGQKVDTVRDLFRICRTHDGDTVTLVTSDGGTERRKTLAFPKPLPVKAASASGCWGPNAGYEADKAVDGDFATRWGGKRSSRSGWLQVDLGKECRVASALIDEARHNRIREFEIQVRDGDLWRSVAGGSTCGDWKIIAFQKPVKGQVFRLNIVRASEVPTISEFQLFP